MEDAAFLAALERRWKRPLKLRFSERGMQDAAPVSLFGLKTVEMLAAEIGTAIGHRRFRANFYAEWKEGGAQFEDSLVGKTIQIGPELRVLIKERDPRCVMINLDPETGEQDPAVLKTVAQKHGACIGVYGVTVHEGVASVGDAIRVAP
ncbi:MAG TPA: MOSC domain-containing protein [Terriglobales bacterium]|nr:MOSC domain-containing protein [Terriglobales bacterium]